MPSSDSAESCSFSAIALSFRQRLRALLLGCHAHFELRQRLSHPLEGRLVAAQDGHQRLLWRLLRIDGVDGRLGRAHRYVDLPRVVPTLRQLDEAGEHPLSEL